jgi:hypothetical protein
MLGKLDAASLIYRENILPVFVQVGDINSLMIGHAKLAKILMQRGDDGDIEEARELLYLALNEARQQKSPETPKIEQIIQDAGFE